MKCKLYNDYTPKCDEHGVGYRVGGLILKMYMNYLFPQIYAVSGNSLCDPIDAKITRLKNSYI